MYTTAQNVWKMTKIMNRNNIVVVIVGACQVDDPADFGGRLDRSTETQNDDGKQRWKWIFFLTRRAASLSVLLTFVITIYHFPFYVSMVFFSLSLCYGRVHLISFRPVLIVLPPALSVSDDKLWLYNCKRVWGAGWRDGTMTKFYVLFFRTQTEIPLFCQQFLMRKMSKDSSRMLDSLSLICIRVGTGKSWSDDDEEQTSYKLKEKKSYNFFFCLVQVQFQFFRRREKFFNFNHHELQVEQKSLNILQESAETWTRGERKFEFQRRRWSEACKKGLSMSNVVERCAAMWMSSEQLDSESFLGQETRYANYHQRTLDIQLLYNRYTISDIGEKTSTTPLRYQRQLDANVRRKISQSMWRAEWAEGRWSQVDNNRFSPHKFAFCRV